jgi:hypothetical protein
VLSSQCNSKGPHNHISGIAKICVTVPISKYSLLIITYICLLQNLKKKKHFPCSDSCIKICLCSTLVLMGKLEREPSNPLHFLHFLVILKSLKYMNTIYSLSPYVSKCIWELIEITHIFILIVE